jgi:membrane protease YdiL (CAAX protease family)
MSVVSRHPMVAFVILAYAISWSLVPMGGFLPPGPLVAALIVISMTQGREGLKQLGARLVRWRVGWIWWVAALALPLGVLAVSVALNVAVGAPAPSLDQFSPWYAVLVVAAVRMISPLDGPGGEEPGFRGFAQPHLQAHRSPLFATSILAVVVAGWHAPLLLVDNLRPVDLLSTVAVTFWYAWLFNHSGGSVLITIVSHVAQGSIAHSDLWPADRDAAQMEYVYAAVACATVVGLLCFDWRFWRSSAPPMATARLTDAKRLSVRSE